MRPSSGFLGLLLVAQAGLAAEPAPFDKLGTGPPRASRIALSGRILFLRAADVTGDRRDDVVVVLETVHDEERSRTVEKDGQVILTVDAVQVREHAAHVFEQDADGAISPTARVVPIDEHARALDAADVDGDGVAELLLLLPDRMVATSLSGNPSTRTLVEGDSVLTPARGAPLSLPMARDLDGDGIAELLVPHPSCLRVYWGSTGGYAREPVQVPLPRLPRTAEGGTSVAGYSLPLLVDATGDGVLDLVHLLPHGELVGWVWKRPGVLAQRTLSGRWTMKGPGFERRFVTARDVNGDDRLDVVMLREPRSGEGDEDAEEDGAPALEVVLGTEEPVLPAEPGMRLVLPEPRSGESLAFCTLEDLDGDGKHELLPTYLRTGAMQMLRAVVTKRADLALRTPVVVQGPAGLRIASTLEDEIPVSLRQLSASYLVTVSADVDGDGRKDLVRPRGEKLEVFRGAGDGTFAGSAALQLPIGEDGGLLGALEVADLDRDGRDDLMLVRESLDKDRLSMRIFVSGGSPRAPEAAR